MRITLLCMGKTDFGFIREGIALYRERMKRYINFALVEIPDKKKGEMSREEWMKREGEQILSQVDGTDYLVLLDERGKQMNSQEFSGFVGMKMSQSVKHLVFVIGGAYGFSPEVNKRANAKISLSSLTFSHQLVRLVFMEQIYRAFTILKGEPYHHD